MLVAGCFVTTARSLLGFMSLVNQPDLNGCQHHQGCLHLCRHSLVAMQPSVVAGLGALTCASCVRSQLEPLQGRQRVLMQASGSYAPVLWRVMIMPCQVCTLVHQLLLLCG